MLLSVGMALDAQLIRDRSAGGEFPFVASGVFLSFQLSQSLDLELRTADSLWSGRSFRGDLKVMLPGETRVFRHKKAASFAHVTISEPQLASFDGSLQRLRPHVILSDVPLRHLDGGLVGRERRRRRDPAVVRGRHVAGSVSAAGGAERAARRRCPASACRRSSSSARSSSLTPRLEDDLSVAALAQACGLSASHFTALFKASAGEPPHRYQTRRRVERARELLLSR